MQPSSAVCPPDQLKRELVRLRQGHGLAHPAVVLELSPDLRGMLVGEPAPKDTAEEIVRIVSRLRRAIDSLGRQDRLYTQVDFNLIPEHSYPTLTERQESLARQLKCAAKTVRRHADKAFDTLALVLVTGEQRLFGHAAEARSLPTGQPDSVSLKDGEEIVPWQEQLRRFWKLSPQSRVDIVCSEIPEDERSDFACPQHRNYLRYAKFADLDSLIYVRIRLTQAFPNVAIRDFSPSEYYETDVDNLIVLGGPPWNAKYREFLAQLPYYFDPHPLGEDDPLVVPQLADLTIGPRWTERGELLEDLAVFTRLTLAQGTTVFLMAGCLTLGVLGAAKCFLQGPRAARNAAYITEVIGDQDFVLVNETRRVGGIADMTDLTMTSPLLLLARQGNRPFSPVIDNTGRYQSPE